MATAWFIFDPDYDSVGIHGLRLRITRPVRSRCEVLVPTIYETSMSLSHATRSWSSRVCRAPASRHWRSAPLYAEAQRRYLESVAPPRDVSFHQMGIPEVDGIDGLPSRDRAAAATRIDDSNT